MSWDAILAAWQEKQDFAASMGGPQKLATRRDAGLLNARERAAALFDDGEFTEIGALAGNLSQSEGRPAPADGLIAGFGMVNGRPVVTMIEDASVLGGSIGDAGAAKRYRAVQLALQEKAPLVVMLDGAGHRPTNRHGTPAPNDLQALAALSGHVPMLCLVLGPSAGHGALAAPLSDLVVMTRAASIFIAGPPIVAGAIGERVTKDELGGAEVQVAAGLVHHVADDDTAAIDTARRCLDWLTVPHRDGPDIGSRRLDGILDIIPPDPRIPFEAQRLLALLADGGEFMELQPGYGKALCATFARLGGHRLLVLCSNPAHGAGAIDAAAAQKASHLLQVADAHGIPVLFLADTPGVQPGTAAERAGTLRHAARMFAIQHGLRVPKLHVTLRKAFGFGSSLMGMNPFDGQTINLAFPAISLGAMPAASGADAAKLDEAGRAEAARRQAQSAWELSDRMVYDDVIDLRDLRDRLIAALALCAARPAHAERRRILP